MSSAKRKPAKLKPAAHAASAGKGAAGLTPVRAALLPSSPLQGLVKEGLGAVGTAHRNYLHADVRGDFADSLELDEAMKAKHPSDPRWDYLLGHAPSAKVVALEPHSAKDEEVDVVIRKRKAALEQLRDHLENGARVDRWLWMASGKVKFAALEKTRRLLDQNGIQFVANQVLPKHLPAASVAEPANANATGTTRAKK